MSRQFLPLLVLWCAAASLSGCDDSPHTKPAPQGAIPTGLRAGSFEALEPGQPLPADGPWLASDPATVVLPTAEDPAQPRIGFPSDGAQWLQVDAGMRGPWSHADYLGKASHVQQEFRCGEEGTILALDVAFVTWEIPGRDTSNDFLSVDVVSGDAQVNLLLVDNASGEFPEKTARGKPSTRRIAVVKDLLEAFPGAGPDTVFTLFVSAVNVGDPGMPSKAWVDHVRLMMERPPEPFDCRITKGADGDWHLVSDAGKDSGVAVRHLITRQISEPTGTGPVFGLAASREVIEQMQAGAGASLHHLRLDASGRTTSEPLAGYPPGTRVDYVGVLLDAKGQVVATSTPRSVVLE